MQKKSIIAVALGILVSGIAFFAPNVSLDIQIWLGLVTFTATFVLTTFYPSGVWVGAGYKAAFYVTVIGGFALQLLTKLDFLHLSPFYVNWIGLAITYLIQEFGRKYPING